MGKSWRFLDRLLPAIAIASFVFFPTISHGQEKKSSIPVRIGVQASPSWLMYTARKLNLLEKVGIEPTYLKFTTGAQALAAVQSNSLDIASPGLPPFVAGLSQGIDWVMIGIDNASPKSEGFLARKDTDIKTIADLKGKTIGVARGSSSYAGLLKVLDIHGIKKSDVKLLLLGPPEQIAAMRNKDVDAVAVWQPWIERLKTEAGARVIGMEADYDIHTGIAIFAARTAFLKENPEAARRFLRAMVMAYDHIQKNGPQDAVEALADAMGVSTDLTKRMYEESGAANPYRWTERDYPYAPVKGGKLSKNLQEMADRLFEDGLYAKKVDVDKYLDSSYIEAVLKTHKKQ